MLLAQVVLTLVIFFAGFNGHPPLGVNATDRILMLLDPRCELFQWAPTLGGECYRLYPRVLTNAHHTFQWAPTLGGECYINQDLCISLNDMKFQWAPTLGGECYHPKRKGMPAPSKKVSMGTHPWG